MDILNINERYIIFDKDTFSIYPIDRNTAAALEAMDTDAQEEIYNMLKDGEAVCSHEAGTAKTGRESRCRRLVVIICQDCNLRCRYCYARQGTYGEEHVKKYMSLKTFQESIYFILSEFPEGVENIQFFGGEPLLNYELLKEACRWTVGFFEEKNIIRPGFSIVTNGTILSDEIIALFNEYKISVTVSLDGNQAVNDINRVYRGDSGSVFNTVEKNVRYLNEKRKFRFGFEATVDKANIEQFKREQRLVDIESLISMKPDFLHIVPAQWNCNSSGHETERMDSGYKEDFTEYFDALSDMLFDKTIRNEVQLTATMDFLSKIKNKSLKKNFCGAGITDFSVNTEGDIYPCFSFTGVEEFKIGNVHTYQEDNQYKAITELFRRTAYGSREECAKCWAGGLCHSCIGLNYLATGTLDTPSESTCTSQKALIKRTMFRCADAV